MTKSNTGKGKQQRDSLMNQQGSGSEYHKEHAGNVEGYGQPHPTTAKDKE